VSECKHDIIEEEGRDRPTEAKPVEVGRPYGEQSAEWRAGYDEAEQVYHAKQRDLRRQLRNARAVSLATPSKLAAASARDRIISAAVDLAHAVQLDERTDEEQEEICRAVDAWLDGAPRPATPSKAGPSDVAAWLREAFSEDTRALEIANEIELNFRVSRPAAESKGDP
jgi:hypothetical protein